MFTITFRFETGNPVTIDANPGEKLLDVARKANVAIDAPCSGNGVCGKCRVRLASGSLDAPINRHITSEEYAAGWRLASALSGGTGSSPLSLRSAEAEEDGWVLRFWYQVDGVPVFFSDGGDALTITFEGGAVTDFTYRCRSYTPLEEESAPLLPAGMAQAIAAAYPEAALSIGYEDDGSGRLAAQWYR